MNAQTSRSSLFFSSDSAERGSTTVETAISFLPFAAILFGLVHLINFGHNALTLNYALNRATRWGVLGLTSTDVDGNALNRFDSIRQRFDAEARRLALGTDDVTLTICPLSNPACTTSVVAGSGQWMVVTASKPPFAIFGYNVRLLTPAAQIRIKNEPF